MPEGKSFNVLLNIMRRRDAVGNVLRVVGIKQDFTELQVAEAVAGGKVTLWNRTAVSLPGFIAEKTLDLDSVDELTTPDQRERVRGVLNDALQEQEAANFESTLIIPDWESFAAVLNATSCRDAVGNLSGVGDAGQDITESKFAEAEAKQHTDDLTQLTDTAKAPILDVDAGGLITNQRERVRSVLSDALQGENTWNETATPEEPEDEHKESEGQLEREELGTAIRPRMIMAAAPRRTEEETGDAGNKTDADEEEDVEHIEDGKGGSEEKGVTLSRKQREIGKEGASAGGEELRGREEIHSRRVWNPTWAEIAARPIPSIPLIPTGSTANPGEKDSGPPRGCQLPVLKRPAPGRRLHEPVTTRAPTNAVPWPKVKTFSKVLPADASGTRLPSIHLGLNLRPVESSCQNLLLRAVLSAVGLCLQLLRIHLGLYLHHVELSRQNFLISTAS